MVDVRSKLIAALLIGSLVAGACASDDDTAGDETSGDDAEPAADAAEAADEDQAGDCDPARELDVASDEAQVFDFDGDERAYLLELPAGYDGSTAHPLVFDFHGFSASKEDQVGYTELAELGAERGYVVVTPHALGEPSDWNYFADETRPDDFGFLDALVTDLSERLCLDPDRIYAAGHSAGSAFSGFLVCQEPYRFAAVAMVAAFIPPNCPVDEVAPSAVVFHGKDDPQVPFDGGGVGGGDVGIPGVLETLDQYVEQYECDEPVEGEAGEDVETYSLSGCVHDSEVEVYAFVGGGHGWPGNAAGVDLGGQPDNALIGFPATETILDFFDEHPG